MIFISRWRSCFKKNLLPKTSKNQLLRSFSMTENAQTVIKWTLYWDCFCKFWMFLHIKNKYKVVWGYKIQSILRFYQFVYTVFEPLHQRAEVESYNFELICCWQKRDKHTNIISNCVFILDVQHYQTLWQLEHESLEDMTLNESRI